MRRVRLATAVALIACGIDGVGGAWEFRGVDTAAAQQVVPEGAPNDIFRSMILSAITRSPGDTLGNSVYLAAQRAFFNGDLDSATTQAQAFVNAYTRNLNMNDALELILLVRDFRDFQDQPLKSYARVLALREGAHPDSAAALAAATLERWPGARVRYHVQFQLAEMARDRGDHAAAVTHALAVADSSSKSRLAPAALKLAGDETIAMGQGPDRALKIYQELLERYPNSPLAPGVRVQVLEMRKKLQL